MNDRELNQNCIDAALRLGAAENASALVNDATTVRNFVLGDRMPIVSPLMLFDGGCALRNSNVSLNPNEVDIDKMLEAVFLAMLRRMPGWSE